MANDSEMTLCNWQARQIEKAARFICHFVENTREDRLRWIPATEEGSKARSVMDVAGECVDSNRRALAYLTGAEAEVRPTNFDRFETVEELSAALIASADALAAEIRNLNGQDLMKEIHTHRGTMPAAVAIQLPLRNMNYHMGQINMIQLLYGDTQFHITPEFLSL